MWFLPSLDTAEIPKIMAAVSKIAPYGWWKRRIEALDAEKRKNPFLDDYFGLEFRIERSYATVHRYHSITGRYPDIADENYDLLSFLSLLVLVYEGLSEKGKRRLRGSVRDGLQDKKGLGPLATELHTAGHLMARGFDVEFTDLEDLAQFDLLVSRGTMEIEIDCKSPSGDVGRQIHALRFRFLANELMPLFRDLTASGGGHLVRVVLPANLHGDVQRERELAKEITQAIHATTPTTPDGSTVSVTPFALTGTPFERLSEVSVEVLADFLERNFGLSNVDATTNWRPGTGATIFVLQSAKPDRVVHGIYRQLAGSAEDQFSGTRPAVLCVQLRAVTAPQLRYLASGTPNGLGAIATRLFGGSKRAHLAGLSFVATSDALTTSRSLSNGVLRTSYQDVGAACVFGNPDNPSGNVVGELFGGGNTA